MNEDEVIQIPPFLSASATSTDAGIMPLCDFCTEVACETDAMWCAECSGQTCSECQGGQCDICQATTQACTTTCQVSCQSGQSSSTPPTYTLDSYTSTSCTITVNVTSGYTSYTILCRLQSNTSDRTYYSENEYHTSSFTRVITGLQPNTAYRLNVSYGTWIGPIDFTTKSGITKWSWISSNGSATATQTQTAYNAVSNQGKLSDFSYLVWNDLCSKIQEVDIATGRTWNSKYASFYDTCMNSDKVMTATRWNSALYNIGAYYSTGLSFHSTGDVIKGSYFITLASKLNEWIDYSNLT